MVVSWIPNDRTDVQKVLILISTESSLCWLLGGCGSNEDTGDLHLRADKKKQMAEDASMTEM